MLFLQKLLKCKKSNSFIEIMNKIASIEKNILISHESGPGSIPGRCRKKYPIVFTPHITS